MYGCVVRQPFETLCHVNQFVHTCIPIIEAAEFRVDLQGTVDRNVQFHRHHFCHTVHLRIRKIECFSNCLDDTAGCHRTKGRNLCHRILSIFFCDVLDHAGTLRILKIHIDIGHRHTLRV